ncbi:enoyl-CoA hydratase-related protein [Mycobacterium sp. MUNTM1]
MTSTHRFLNVDIAEGIATVTMNRPPVNALNPPMMREIGEVFTALGADTSASVAILDSRRSDVFCAGADISESERRHVRRQITDDETVADLLDPGAVVRRCFEAVRAGGLPVIAAVSGAAIGAGVALISCTDLVVAGEDAYVSLPEINVGVAGGYRHLQRLVGRSKARQMALTGCRVSAAEMYRLGAVVEVVPTAQVAAAARSLAVEMAAKSPLGLRVMRESIIRSEDMPLDDGYRLEQDYTARASLLADSQEARAAWREKREPIWAWR